MSSSKISGRRVGYSDLLVDAGDGVGQINTESAAVAKYHLLPGEEAASLPQTSLDEQSTMAPLTRFMGASLTFANPVWGGEPIPRMRSLQKKMIEHSLTLETEDRRECLDAITVVENDVQWRLRFQQMRMSDDEMAPDPDAVMKKITKAKEKSIQEEDFDPTEGILQQGNA